MAKPSQRQPTNGLFPSSRLSCLFKNIGVRPRCAAPRARYIGSRRSEVSPTCHGSRPTCRCTGAAVPARPCTHRASPGRLFRIARRAKRTCHHRGVGSQAPHFPEPLARLDRRHELTRIRAVDAVERGTTPPHALHATFHGRCRRNSSPPGDGGPTTPSEVNRWFASLCDYAAMVRGWWRRGSRSGCGSVRPCGRAASASTALHASRS